MTTAVPAATLAILLGAGCPGGGNHDAGTYDLAMSPGDMATNTPPDLANAVILKRSSKSSAIATSDDDKTVAAVSPDDDRLYLVNTTSNTSTPVQLAAGCEPRSVAYAPDGSFWVACRGNGTVVRVSNTTVGNPIVVGAEPAAVAITPAGTKVVVANYADGNISIVDTTTRAVTNVDVGQNPRAVAITNGGTGNDRLETVYVTLMFGQLIPGITASEGSDVGRQGIVVPVNLTTNATGTTVKLAPVANTTFSVANLGAVMVPVGAYPNQLQAIAIQNGKIYVPSTAASPAGPVNFAGNYHPFVSVFDQTGGTERAFGNAGAAATTACGTMVTAGQVGYGAGTVDLAIQVRDLNTAGGTLLFPTNPVDIGLVPNANLNVGYVVSMASDVITRVAWDYTANTSCVGAASVKQINLQASMGDIQVPIGIVVSNDQTKAYVNSWVGRQVQVIDLASQTVTAHVTLTAQPAADPGLTLQKGKKFFWTSTGRWSNKGWGSCGSCHPDGLSDNVTFVFASGPRNTLPLDAIFAKSATGVADLTDQRILNWTAINDEVHDFENNTRGVSGGVGAVVSTTATGSEVGVNLTVSGDGGTNGSVKKLALDNTTVRTLLDATMGTVDIAKASAWDAIELYVSTLRSLKHSAKVDATSAQRGATVFTTGACANCHAGAKWTISKRPITVAQLTQGKGTGSTTCALQTTALAKKSVPVAGNMPQNNDGFQLENERPGSVACTVAGTQCATIVGASCNATSLLCTLVPQRLSCPLRNVGTFGAGPQGAAFEVRSDTTATAPIVSLAAEGAAGFNPPSLLSLDATAPYLHNGAAQTLTDLLTNVAFKPHLTSGNVNFAPSAGDVTDLVNYLRSIDQATTPITVNAMFDLCTGSFTANAAAVCSNP